MLCSREQESPNLSKATRALFAVQHDDEEAGEEDEQQRGKGKVTIVSVSQ